MSSDDGNSRSERLRKRRDRSGDRDEPAEQADPSQASEPAESVKDEQVGTYMYLPQSQKKELDRLYNILKAEYEYEFDREFEKNRHFFPLVIHYGLERLEGLDASDIQDRLDSM